jgi:hypothetical protein
MNRDMLGTVINDLAKAARNSTNASHRRSLRDAAEELERLHRGESEQIAALRIQHDEETHKLRARIEELEGIIDWHIDMVVGDAWLCRIEGKYEDIADLLGDAVGKQIQSYEIDTQHHEEIE